MTGEEFLQAAGDTIFPAVTALIEMAFETVPKDDVGPLIVTYLGTATLIAVERVHEIIAQTGSAPTS